MTNKIFKIILISLLLVLSTSCSETESGVLKTEGELMEYSSFKFEDFWWDENALNYILNDVGGIKDAETAASFADVLFKSMFGDDYNNWGLPLKVSFDESEGLWMAQTQMPQDSSWVGGLKYIAFRKSNAEIVGIKAEK